MTPGERLELLMRFKGFGNPRNERKICFVGIEEASGFSCLPIRLLDDEVLQRYAEEFKIEEEGDYYEYRSQWNRDNAPKRYTKVYEYMAKIIKNIEPEITEKDILDNYLFTNNGLAFQFNIYPLGRKNTREATIDFTDPNRFDLNSYQHYQRIVRERRFPLLLNFWNTNRDNFAITICFGSTYWKDYKMLFDIERNAEIDTDYFKYFERENILLTPFFKSGNGGLNNNLLDEIYELLNNNNIYL